MKSWKEVPHLFANGKFSLLQSDKLTNKKRPNETIIPPELWGMHGDSMCKFEYPNFVKGIYPDRSQLFLIARPISDMTDEEVRELKGIPSMSSKHCRLYKETLIAKSNSGKLEYYEWMGLMRYGIYWGPQSHFGDTVINASSLEEA